MANENIEAGSFCYPSIIKDVFLMVVFPPLWVILKEIYSPIPLQNIVRIIFSLVFTSCFYFPGLIHAMSIFRKEGGIDTNSKLAYKKVEIKS